MTIWCKWIADVIDGGYFTDCGKRFIVENGTPLQNGMRYCCYCGNKLKQR